jgi:hypothetical protein
MDYSELPQPIEPVYSTDYPSKKIHLYEGEIKCSYEVNGNLYNFQGTGTIEYTWFPNPQPIFKISHSLPIPHDLDNSNIMLPDSDRLIPIRIQNWDSRHERGKSTYHISGSLTSKSVVGREDDLHSIIFHIVNFCKYINEVTTANKGRITLFEKDWEIIIDEASSKEKKSSELFNDLKESGGYAITHIGRIKKNDNSKFSAEQAVEIIEILSHFLSFARGLQVPIVLLVGYNIAGDKVYEQWNDAFGNPWKSRDSWLPKQDLRKVQTIFPKFVSWWKDWGQAAQIVLNMYIEANHNNFGDITIILTQSVLELIARVVLVEKKSVIAASEYDKRGVLSPAQKISHLLNELSIPGTLQPSHNASVDDLIQFVADNIPESDYKNKSASEASIVFTKIRNDITHAKKQYTPSSAVLFNTMSLGLWYIEMVILAILEYDGVYSNRLRRPKWAGEYDLVPWAEREESELPLVESSEAIIIPPDEE